MEKREHIWQTNKSATLKDVAAEVGVSESLASFVLNGSRSGARVSAKTRLSIVEAGERLGYRPNALARSLTTGRSDRIGVYSGKTHIDTRNPFLGELIGGVVHRAREAGLNTVLHSSGDGMQKVLDLVSNRALDGLLVYAERNDPILQVLDQLVIPAVALADRIESLPSSVTDDYVGGSMQARYLSKMGHRHVLLKQVRMTPMSVHDRMTAFASVAAELGMKVSWSTDDAACPEGVSESDVALMTKGEHRATALVAWNDFTAECACVKLTALGVAIPDDVAVVGFDGFSRCFLPKFERTTIGAEWGSVGYNAACILTDIIEGNAVPMLTVQPVKFIQGKTA